MKIDNTILKETKYIAISTILMSVLFQAIFLVLKRWDYTVLLGNILSALVGILNFFFMGLTVQKALEKDAQDAKKMMRASQGLRNLGVFVCLVAGVLIPHCNVVATIVPIFFPRIAVALRPIVDKKGEKEKE